MIWIIAGASAFFFFALGTTIERFFLGRQFLNPKTASFIAGLISVGYVFFIPFVDFDFNVKHLIFNIFLTAGFQTLGLLLLYYSLSKFDATQIVPTLGAFMPIFSFGVGIFLSNSQINLLGFIAFAFLLSGTIIVSYNKNETLTFEALSLILFSAIMLSSFYISARLVFNELNFWSTLIWINIFQVLISSLFLLSKTVRSELRNIIFKTKKYYSEKKFGAIKYPFAYGLAKVSGFLGATSQLYALNLTPISYIGIIQAMQGLEHIFIIVLTLLFYYKITRTFPTDIYEKKTLFKRLLGIGLIIIGLIVTSKI